MKRRRGHVIFDTSNLLTLNLAVYGPSHKTVTKVQSESNLSANSRKTI